MGRILENDYELQTTFWDDFCIAELFGYEAIKDTYDNAFNSWKDNVVFVTELVMVLNWKCWQHFDKGNDKLSGLYQELFEALDAWCLDNLKGSDLEYFITTTD